MQNENFHCLVQFDPTVVVDVPKNPADFRRYYSPEDVQLFTMFEICDSRERSLFEFNLASKEFNKHDKPIQAESRKARVDRLAAFYAENAAAEISPFEDN